MVRGSCRFGNLWGFKYRLDPYPTGWAWPAWHIGTLGYINPPGHRSPVHVVLVSLLVDQLSGLFLIFLVDQRKNCPVSGNFWSVSGNFWSTKFLFGIPKIFLVDQIFFWSPKNSQRLTNFFWVEQKN